MKLQLKPLALSLCLLGLVNVPAYADEANPSNNNNVEVQQPVKKPHHHAVKKKKAHAKTDSRLAMEPADIAKIQKAAEASEAKENVSTEATIAGPSYLPQNGIQYFPMDVDVPGQSFVSTGPYIGVPLQYAGSNLIVNTPSVNQDVALLNLRKNINQRLAVIGLKPSDERSHLLLSGVVEGQANYKNVGGGPDSSDINLTNVGLDAYVLGPSTWTSALISFRYNDNIGSQSGSLSSNSRAENSRVFISKAFIIVGDFLKSPFYGTLGQMYVPFGTYSTTMISTPLTQLLGRIHQRAILLGYQEQTPNALYASTFVFKGDSYVGATSRINNGGINIGYRYECGIFSGDFGGGVIANIADSQGMQNNGNPVTTPLEFAGFGGVSGSGVERIAHRVPAYNLRGLFSIGDHVDLLAEFIGASTGFNQNDMTFKSHSAKPLALNAEAAYTFQAFSRPTSLSVGYGMTKEALALGLDASRYVMTVNTSFWRNTLQSLEFRRDMNYAASATATGSGLPVPNASGARDTVITAQFDLFF